MSVTYAYLGEITKTDKTPDGDLLVYGKATGPDLDLDEQRCDPAWLKTAMPAWAQWGNIREQHSAIAAGVGIETAEQGDDWYVKSLVTDPTTAHKVETKTLKGYSIGIKGARVVKDATAPGGRIVGGEIVEISLVDRPCNPTATMALAKAAGEGGGKFVPVDQAGELVMDLSKAVIVDAPAGEGAASKKKAAPSRPAGVLSKRKHAAALDLVKRVLAGEQVCPVLTKDAAGYDESADIAGALAVIKGIADLIRSEAASLGQGRLEECYDISCLMDAVSAMKSFLCREKDQDAGPGTGPATPGMSDSDLSYVQLGADGDTNKAEKYSAEQKKQMMSQGKAIPNAKGEPSYPIDDREDVDNAVHAVGRGNTPHGKIRSHIKRNAKRVGASDLIPDAWKKGAGKATSKTATITGSGENSKTGSTSSTEAASITPDVIKSAVAEATAADKERITALEAQLAKVLATPIPGGPLLVTPQTKRPADTPAMQKAARLRAIAAQTSDPEVRRSYLELAAREEGAPIT